MRIIAAVFAGLVLVSGAQAQRDEDDSMGELLSEKKYYRCVDYNYNATLLIPRLHREGKVDSIYMILDYIDRECESTPRTRRTRLLLKIEENEFTEDLYDSTVLNDIIYYKRTMAWIDLHGYEDTWYSDNDADAEPAFEEFFLDLAKGMYDKYPPGTLEHLWSGFYKGDFSYFFRDLKTAAYAGTDLQNYYLSFLRNLEDNYKNRGTHYAGLAGFWRPLGANRILGDKPELGGIYGQMWGRWQWDLAVAFRFMNAEEEYVYREEGILDTTDYFFGMYAGVDIGYDLYTSGNHRFEVVGGVAYDGFQVRASESDYDSHNISSLNLNFGVRYKLFLSRYHDWYVGLHGRYNVIKYGTGGGSDLSGNAISVQLVVGYINNGTFKRYARALGYFE